MTKKKSTVKRSKKLNGANGQADESEGKQLRTRKSALKKASGRKGIRLKSDNQDDAN